MEDIRSVLSMYKSKAKSDQGNEPAPAVEPEIPTLSEIPDIFFDEILPYFKLSRTEISVLMFLYRQVWCRPNLYRDHGIGPLNSYAEVSRLLHMQQGEVINALKSLESHQLVMSVRAGQYFVRKFFTEEFDDKYAQHYEF
ncbi:MAG: hypothetical protein LW878_10265 [Proteobacteria bacterium]|nr:hypothetical protein [Pseudomonadota bacterium]